MDPALRGHVTGDGEQTIGKIQTYGERRRSFPFYYSQVAENVVDERP